VAIFDIKISIRIMPPVVAKIGKLTRKSSIQKLFICLIAPFGVIRHSIARVYFTPERAPWTILIELRPIP
jgi:hypothetical protein